jgi:hypothetical protein
MNATMLPSAVGASREKRLRTFRLLLDEHRPLRMGAELRTVGCSCGWLHKNQALFGEAAHRDHVATQLADAA